MELSLGRCSEVWTEDICLEVTSLYLLVEAMFVDDFKQSM